MFEMSQARTRSLFPNTLEAVIATRTMSDVKQTATTARQTIIMFLNREFHRMDTTRKKMSTRSKKYSLVRERMRRSCAAPLEDRAKTESGGIIELG